MTCWFENTIMVRSATVTLPCGVDSSMARVSSSVQSSPSHTSDFSVAPTVLSRNSSAPPAIEAEQR
jgi:hypothetical protein